MVWWGFTILEVQRDAGGNSTRGLPARRSQDRFQRWHSLLCGVVDCFWGLMRICRKLLFFLYNIVFINSFVFLLVDLNLFSLFQNLVFFLYTINCFSPWVTTALTRPSSCHKDKIAHVTKDTEHVAATKLSAKALDASVLSTVSSSSSRLASGLTLT